MPFVLANAALAMDVQATIVLNGDGVTIAQKDFAETMPPGGGFPPMKKLVADFMELGGKMWVCGPCIKTREIDESALIEGATITGSRRMRLMWKPWKPMRCSFFKKQGACGHWPLESNPLPVTENVKVRRRHETGKTQLPAPSCNRFDFI
jgi:predicted peroxiredoxin